MGKALHVICRARTGGKRGREGVELLDNKRMLFTSDAWVKNGWTPETIVGAMLYMHQAQNTPSEFGGEILACDLISPKSSGQPNDRYRFTFKSMHEGRGVEWRGNIGPTEQGGLVEV
ncbi:MAG: hypothetical protein N4A53_02725 [Pelagimonas sp.]|jgi:hypothetical protein|nr:hypothetical protein [Pelagimonas sp.]